MDGTLVVSSPNHNGYSGAIYVYVPDAIGDYGAYTKLTAPVGAPSGNFGSNVSIGADGTLLVGARGDDDVATDAGAVFVYTPDHSGGFNAPVKLTAPDGTERDYFGYGIAMGSDGLLAVGAWADDAGIAPYTGSVYLYKPDASGDYASPPVHLLPPDAEGSERFGQTLTLSADGILVVAAIGDADNGAFSGSVYVYLPDATGNYGLPIKLTAPDAETQGNFGSSVSVNPDGSVLVGAQNQDGVTTDTGATYLFVPDGNGGYVDYQGTVYAGMPENVAPTLTGLDGVTFLENTVNAAPQIIDADVTFADIDSSNLATGKLTVSGFVNGQDTIGIHDQGAGATNITLSGSDVSYGGTVIGTVSGGSGANDLEVTFKVGATSTAVDALIQNITYANSSNTPAAARALTITVTDGDGGTVSATSVVNVTAEADTKVLTFEDLGHPTADWMPMPATYAGFNWNNIGLRESDKSDPNLGYDEAAVSGDNVIYNRGGAVGTVSTVDGSEISFEGAYFTAVYVDGLTVTVTGYRDGLQIDTTSFNLKNSAATWIDFPACSFMR